MKLVAEAEIDRGSRVMAADPQGRGVAAPGKQPKGRARERRRIVVFDRLLREAHQFTLDNPAPVRDLSIDPTNHRIAVSWDDGVAVFDREGKAVGEVRHRWGRNSRGACMFSPDGRYLWIAAPGGCPSNPQIQVLDAGDCSIVASASLGLNEECGFELTAHPENVLVAVFAGAGQDGLWNFFCHLEGSKLAVFRLKGLDGTGLVAFHPSGAELLTTSIMDGFIERRRLPDLKLIGRNESESGVRAAYLSDDEALVLSYEGEELRRLELKTLAAIDAVRPDPYAASSPRKGNASLDALSDVEDVRRFGDEHILTLHRPGRIRLWEAPELLQGFRPVSGSAAVTRKFLAQAKDRKARMAK